MKKMTKTAAVALVAIATAMSIPFSASALRSHDDGAKWGAQLNSESSRTVTRSTDDSPRWGKLLDSDSRNVARDNFDGPRWKAAEGREGREYIPSIDGRPRWGLNLDKETVSTKTAPTTAVAADSGSDEADK